MFIILWHARKAYASNLITQGVDFEVVRPAGATHCMVRGEIWRVGFGSLLDVKLHSVGAGVSVGPETENFTPFRNINASQLRMPCAIFTKFADFVPRFRMRQVLKVRWICSRGYGVIGVLS